MTLRTQMFIFVISLFTLIFISTFAISVRNIESFLVEQMTTQNSNTAHSLAVSISQHRKVDELTMGILLDAIFKTGYYEKISIIGLDEKVMLEREQHIAHENVPSWLPKIVPLDVPPGNALIQSGWKQLGTIFVYSDMQAAYEKLWEDIVHLFFMFLIMGTIIILLGLLALHHFLKPLTAVKRQAEALCRRDFSIHNEVPRTKELATIVTAMNKVTDRIHTIFDGQNQLIEKLRENTYKDPLTGIGNRRYFNMQLEHLIAKRDDKFDGSMFLVAFEHMDEFKKSQGYEAIELYIKRIAEMLESFCTKQNHYIVSRLSDTEFSLLAPHITREQMEKVVTNLDGHLAELHANIDKDCVTCHVGVAFYRPGMTSSELVTQTDMALRAAQQEGDSTWHVFEDDYQASDAHCAQEWQALLEDVLDKEDIILHYQPIIDMKSADRKVLHHEILLRIHDQDKNLMNAGMFIPMAENFNLMPKFDKLVVQRVIKLLQSHPNNGHKLAINLSPHSIDNRSFTNWLYETLAENQKIAKQLIFELPEQTAIHELDVVHELVSQLGKLNCEFSLDHFGRGFASFKYLQDLKVTYIKIDGSYIRNIHSDTGNQFFVHVVTQIAHNLHIKIIAENVESEADRLALEELHIDGLQGYLIGRPQDKLE